MKNLTVLIPTANRPDMLRTALRSVASQTAADRILEVVVIENGLNRRSESVCAEFSTLPIRYLFRDPPIPPGTKPERFLEELHGEWVAVLFDDDWWAPEHLAAALRSLERERRAVAYFCAYFHTTGESSFLEFPEHHWLSWFAVIGEQPDGIRQLDLESTVVACLIATPFVMSSMVAHRDTWAECVLRCFVDNSYDTDRHTYAELAKRGTLLCNSHPYVYMRRHAGQETVRLTVSGEAARAWAVTTQRIEDIARAANIDVAAAFERRLNAADFPLGRISHIASHGSVEALVERGFLPIKAAEDLRRAARRDRLRRWVPEVALSLYAKVKRDGLRRARGK